MLKNNYLQPLVAKLLAACLLLLLGANAHSQSNIFTTVSGGAGTLVGEQTTRYNKLSLLTADVVEIQIIQIGNLATIQQNGLLTVTLPGGECDPIVYKMETVAYDSPNNYTWYGEVDRTDTSEWRSGNLMLIAENGAMFGYLTIEDRFYNIEDLTDGKQALVRRTNNQIGTCGTGEGELKPKSPEEYAVPTAQDRTENCDIRILVLYTDAAIARFPTVAGIATTAIAQTKQAFLNSALGTSQVNLVTAGIEAFPGYLESGKKFDQVLKEIDNVPSFVDARRTATGADLVVLLVDKNVMLVENPIGIAWVGAASPSFGFAVVNAFAAHGSGFTFVHEVGHNLGALHEPCLAEDAGMPGCDDNGVYEHAHTWSYRKMCGCGWFWLESRTVRRRTIMYSQGGYNSDVIQHFSNPNVKYEGRPTGVANERHNSRLINDNACTVANYLNTFNPSLSVNIIGPHFVCEGVASEYYAASVSGPPAPYTYAWQIAIPSSGGTAFGPVVSTNSFLDLDLSGYIAGQHITLKVTVTKNGITATSFKTIEILDPSDINCFRSETPDNSLRRQLDANGAVVYPNPSEGSVTIEFLSEVGSQGKVEVLNQLGQVVAQVYEGVFSVQKTTLQANLSGLPDGVYFLSVSTSKGQKTARFTLAK